MPKLLSGFLLQSDVSHVSASGDEALSDLGARAAGGQLRYKESVVEGLENAPRGLIDLLAGKNFGKQLVRL